MTRADRALVIAVVLHAVPARAQSAEAETLFRDGRRLIMQGELAAGCAKLETSERLESSVGTLLNLGDCREKLGKLASAWAAFRKAESSAKHVRTDEKRETEARKRALAIEPLMSSLTLVVLRRPEGLVIKRDGVTIDPALLDTRMPIDPGSYEIVAEAPGYASWRSTIVITYKTNRSVAVPALMIAHPRAARVPPPPPPVVHRESSVWSPWRKMSMVLAIAGAGAAGTGVYYWSRGRALESDANRRCPEIGCSDPVALRDNAGAREAAVRANALYIGGGLAVGSALLLWIAGGPSETTVVTPVAGAGQAGVSVAGRF